MDSLTILQDLPVEDSGHMAVKATGKTIHAAFPEGSDNAVVRLACVITGVPFLTEKEKACSRFPDQGFTDYYGEGMGIGFEDGLSGRLTLVGGVTGTERGRFMQGFGIRYPVMADAEVLVRQMSAITGTYGWTLAWSRNNPPCVINPENPVVRELTSLCCQVLGAEAEACSADGGTYIKKLSGAVASRSGTRG